MPRTILVGALVAVCTFAHVAHAQTATTTSDAPIPTTSATPSDPLAPVEAKVRAYFADIPVMIAIARCESNFRQFDSSGNPLYGGTGGMVGVFQVAAAVHTSESKQLGLDINTLQGNLDYARYLYENEGTVPWLASSGCWNPIAPGLKVGSSGAAVKALQKTLNRNGYTIAKSGEGSPGNESTYFGVMTRDAVRRFQCDMRIACAGSEKTSGYGMVGAKTRLALLKVDGRDVSQAKLSGLSQE